MPIFLDFEASSLDLIHSYPVEVGWVDSEAPEPESHWIQPDERWGWRSQQEWDPESQRIHGLDRSKLEVCGTPAWVVADRMNAVMGGRIAYVDSRADPFWADTLFAAAKRQGSAPQDFEIQRIEQLLYRLWRKQPWAYSKPTEERLREAKAEATKRITQDRGLVAHRAGNDALILLEFYRILALGR